VERITVVAECRSERPPEELSDRAKSFGIGILFGWAAAWIVFWLGAGHG
jgi:hypothetical protein